MYFFWKTIAAVIINRIKGIEIHDEPDAWYLHVEPEKTGIAW